jgi:hypothetical protein
VLAWFGVCSLRTRIVARLEELKIEYVPKEKKSNKRVIATVDQKFVGQLKKEGLQQKISSTRCKVLDGKDQKIAKSIEITGICKVIKEVSARAFFASNLHII